jgi:hypothetical protein
MNIAVAVIASTGALLEQFMSFIHKYTDLPAIS